MCQPAPSAAPSDDVRAPAVALPPSSHTGRASRPNDDREASISHIAFRPNHTIKWRTGGCKFQGSSVQGEANDNHSWSIIVGLVFIALFSVAAWFASPKGENQTYVSLSLSSPASLPSPVLSALSPVSSLHSWSLQFHGAEQRPGVCFTRGEEAQGDNKPGTEPQHKLTIRSQALALNPDPFGLVLLPHVG